jgi:hypothetical protein
MRRAMTRGLVESLQSQIIFTMSHWSSGLHICFSSQGTQVQIPRGYLCETGILLLALFRYRLLFLWVTPHLLHGALHKWIYAGMHMRGCADGDYNQWGGVTVGAVPPPPPDRSLFEHLDAHATTLAGASGQRPLSLSSALLPPAKLNM